jgi:uncharacterized protein YjbI with pentapeptide repeats
MKHPQERLVLRMAPTVSHGIKIASRRAMVLLLLMVSSFVSVDLVLAADCRSSPDTKVDWSGCYKRQLMLGGSNLRDANLYDSDLSFTDLSNANLQSADLEKATLIRTLLAGSKADGAKFDRIEAYRSEMSRMSAVDATFVSAEMQRVSLRGANLAGADFTKAELGRVNFEKAILTGVKFTLANMSRVSLNNARVDGGVDFDEAFMFRTRIEGVDLSTAKGLKQDQVDLACGDSKTRLPLGLTAPSDWPCQSDD